MKPTNHPKYPVFKSIGYMLKMAWNHGRSVLTMCLVIAATKIGLNLAQLYIAPQILGKVESSAPPGGAVWHHCPVFRGDFPADGHGQLLAGSLLVCQSRCADGRH